MLTAILCAALLSPPPAGEPASAAAAPAFPFFAFCMDTHDAKKRSPEEQARMLKDLGYDGAGHLWLDGLDERIRTLDAAGLKLFQVYFRVDLSKTPPFDPRLKDSLPLLKGRGVQLATIVSGAKPSDESQDPRAVEILRQVADLAAPQGVRLVLYPHVGDWIERLEDAVRVAGKLERANAGVMFNLCHWMKTGDEKGLRPLLERARPFLAAASVNGCDRPAEVKAGTGGWILPLDQGAFDVGGVLEALRGAGFRGPVGLQCYGIPGDAREHLERSLGAWKKIQERLARIGQPLVLWPGGAPGAAGQEPADIPTLTPYFPPRERATGASVVVCPGGGYGGLADHEGKPVAEWLNTLGVAGFVLKYRHAPRYRHPAPLQDAARAIRTVRARAAEWGLRPDRIGILGFSAGGHLASTAGTHFDAGRPGDPDPIERAGSRPDLMILIYPVITLKEPSAHTGSRRNLLGPEQDPKLVELLSNETQVTRETPPAFLIHTVEDAGVPYENSLLFAAALRKAGVPHELHLYERGPHGFGLGGKDPALSSWPGRCADWLRIRGFVPAAAPAEASGK